MILKNMIVCSFETLQYLKLISLHNKVWPNPSEFTYGLQKEKWTWGAWNNQGHTQD